MSGASRLDFLTKNQNVKDSLARCGPDSILLSLMDTQSYGHEIIHIMDMESMNPVLNPSLDVPVRSILGGGIKTGQEIQKFDHSDRVTSVCYSVDGNFLQSADSNRCTFIVYSWATYHLWLGLTCGTWRRTKNWTHQWSQPTSPSLDPARGDHRLGLGLFLPFFSWCHRVIPPLLWLSLGPTNNPYISCSWWLNKIMFFSHLCIWPWQWRRD